MTCFACRGFGTESAAGGLASGHTIVPLPESFPLID